jgi:hypothetical protein
LGQIPDGSVKLGEGKLFTVILTVSLAKQLPDPREYTALKVPAVEGVKIPPDVTPVPDQVPPAGLANS